MGKTIKNNKKKRIDDWKDESNQMLRSLKAESKLKKQRSQFNRKNKEFDGFSV
jgi:hypothetical protein